MYENMRPDSEPTPAEMLPFWKTWYYLLTHPSVSTFEEILNDRRATSSRAYLWVYLTITAVMAISYLFIGLIASLRLQQQTNHLPGGLSPLVLVCCAPVTGGLALLGLIIYAGIIHNAAKSLGGTGNYAQLIYALSAVYAPIYLLTAVLGALASIPLVSCLTAPVQLGAGLYMSFLNAMAIKAVHKIGWGAVFGSMLIYVGIMFILAVAVLMFALIVVMSMQK
jgi:hypothetical protein